MTLTSNKGKCCGKSCLPGSTYIPFSPRQKRKEKYSLFSSYIISQFGKQITKGYLPYFSFNNFDVFVEWRKTDLAITPWQLFRLRQLIKQDDSQMKKIIF